jgi:hypothetical protein
MSRIGKRVRDAVNPLSTAATSWWCHSALRYRLTGYGRPPRLPSHQAAGRAPSAEAMAARAAAVDQLLARQDGERG